MIKVEELICKIFLILCAKWSEEPNGVFDLLPFFPRFRPGRGGVLILLLVAAWTGRAIEIESKSSPLLFKQRGKVEISGRSYHTILEVSVEGLIDTLTPIGEGIQEINQGLEIQLQRLETTDAARRSHLLEIEYNNSSNSGPFLALSVAMNGHMRDHLRFLMADLKDKHEQLNSFLQTIGKAEMEPVTKTSPSRQTRGLIDGGGKILNWLLGVATEDEVVDTQDLINKVTELAEKTRVEVNLHSEILNTTAINFDKIDDHMGKLSECLNQVKSNVISLSDMIDRDIARTHSIVHAIIMTNSLAYASSALTDLANQFLNLKIGLNRFRSGYLSPEIIPPSTILKLIEVITGQNLHPIYPANAEYLPLLYKFIKVDAIPLRPLSFIISVPLTGDPKITLELYEIFNMPHPVSAKLTMTYSNIPKYLAVSDDRQIYQTFESMESCRHHGSYFLCPTDLAVYRDIAPSCALNLFRGFSDEHCDRHFSGPLHRPELVKTDLGWLYSFSKSSNISITCPHNTTMVRIPLGSGRLHTGPHCKISGKEFILPSEAEPTGDPISFKAGLVAPFMVRLSEGELEKIELMESSDILTNIMTLNNDKLPLKSLKNEVRQLAYIKKMRQINSITANTGIALSTLSFIGVIFIIVIIVCFVRVASKQKHRRQIVQYFNQGERGEAAAILPLAENIKSERVMTDHLEQVDIEDEDLRLRNFNMHQSPSLIRTTTRTIPIMDSSRHTKTLSDESVREF